jgi:hypothetical protein
MTTAIDLRPTASVIEGWLDHASAGRAFGWACDRGHPEDPLEVEIRLAADDGSTSSPLATVRADRSREDLKAGGFGDGRYGFDARFDLPDGADPARIVALARSPRTGAGQILGRAGADVAEPRGGAAGMATHLQRIVGGLALVRREQAEQMAAVKADLRQELTRLAARSGDATDLRRLADGLDARAERVGAVEVFLVRLDGSLRSLDEAVRRGRPGDRASPVRVALVVGAGAAALGLCAVLARLAFFG